MKIDLIYAICLKIKDFDNSSSIYVGPKPLGFLPLARCFPIILACAFFNRISIHVTICAYHTSYTNLITTQLIGSLCFDSL